MRIYAHTNYLYKGYNRFTHEAIIFTQDNVLDVPDEVGHQILGSHPLQFCAVPLGSQARDHRCPINAHMGAFVGVGNGGFRDKELAMPQAMTEIKRGRGRPRKVGR